MKEPIEDAVQDGSLPRASQPGKGDTVTRWIGDLVGPIPKEIEIFVAIDKPLRFNFFDGL